MYDYKIYRKDRTVKISLFRRGEGVLIAFHNKKSKFFVLVGSGDNQYILGIPIVPPGASFESYVNFTEYLESENIVHCEICILGDFNLPHCT